MLCDALCGESNKDASGVFERCNQQALPGPASPYRPHRIRNASLPLAPERAYRSPLPTPARDGSSEGHNPVSTCARARMSHTVTLSGAPAVYGSGVT